tara:strand:- start:7941 stop:8066 length:126 start_codon:yes stop_codon:yes gene_type:complete
MIFILSLSARKKNPLLDQGRGVFRREQKKGLISKALLFSNV